MRRITRYDIVIASTIDELKVEMSEAIEGGWQPYGSLTTGLCFIQPIVLYEVELP